MSLSSDAQGVQRHCNVHDIAVRIGGPLVCRAGDDALGARGGRLSARVAAWIQDGSCTPPPLHRNSNGARSLPRIHTGSRPTPDQVAPLTGS